MKTFRIFCTIFLLVSVCAFPLFFTIGIGLFAIIWFRNYYEIIPLAFLHDVLYGIPMHRFHSFAYIMTLAAVILVAMSATVRKHMIDRGPAHI